MVYELPFGRGKLFAGNSGRAEDLIIGGWQITGTTTWGSGLPWTPSTNECGGEEDVGVCRPNKGSGSFPIGAGSLQHPADGGPSFNSLRHLLRSGDHLQIPGTAI